MDQQRINIDAAQANQMAQMWETIANRDEVVLKMGMSFVLIPTSSIAICWSVLGCAYDKEKGSFGVVEIDWKV